MSAQQCVVLSYPGGIPAAFWQASAYLLGLNGILWQSLINREGKAETREEEKGKEKTVRESITLSFFLQFQCIGMKLYTGID